MGSAAADKIVKEQKLKGTDVGLQGGGLYFAATIEEVSRKEDLRPKETATKDGVILSATVKLGKVKEVNKADGSMSFRRLMNQGFDSVKSTILRTGDEYVVYNIDQVSNIQMISLVVYTESDEPVARPKEQPEETSTVPIMNLNNV